MFYEIENNHIITIYLGNKITPWNLKIPLILTSLFVLTIMVIESNFIQWK